MANNRIPQQQQQRNTAVPPMENPNSDVNSSSVDESVIQRNKVVGIHRKFKDIDRTALSNSFNAVISDIQKKKGKCMIDETNCCKKWASLKGKLTICPSKKRSCPPDSESDDGVKCFKGACDSSPGRSFNQNQSHGLGEGSHGGHYHMPGAQLPPLYVMLNTDFIVTSPLKQNLMLTLALTQRKRDLEIPEEGKLILVGHFRAFLSFRHFGLGPDALRVRTECNAGGTSTISESLSVEYFVRRFQAKDIVTEMEVEYCSLNWKKVDYICTLYGQRVGVSVTRAMSYPDPDLFSPEMANRLLHKKLFGLVVAREGVADKHCFSQCILHVWCETEKTARLLEAEYAEVSQELEITDDVIMVLTVADGLHAKPIFYEHCLN
eukprot:Gb_31383 [translate_table: standard]